MQYQFSVGQEKGFSSCYLHFCT